MIVNRYFPRPPAVPTFIAGGCAAARPQGRQRTMPGTEAVLTATPTGASADRVGVWRSPLAVGSSEFGPTRSNRCSRSSNGGSK